MRRSITVVGLLVLVVWMAFGGSRAAAQEAADIEGVWRLVEVTTTGRDGRSHTTTPQAGLSMYTEGHFSFMFDRARDIRPDLAQRFREATGDEFRATFGRFSAGMGTYEVSGGQLRVRFEVALTPGLMAPDVFQVYSIELDGDTLLYTPLRNQNGPYTNPAIFKMTRVK